MKSLETLNLSFCSNIEKFPDIPEVMENLSELYLQGTAIRKLPSSINNLTGLVALNLEYCRDLEILPRSIVRLKSIKFLNLSGCSKLEVFPKDVGNMEGLRELRLDKTSIRELCPSISSLKNLESLSLEQCKELRSLPSIIHMRSLRTLNLSCCSNLYQFPEILEVMENLLELNLDDTAISELPSSIQNLTGLVTLNLKGCRRLKILPSSIHWRSLQTLNLSGCSNLKKLPEFQKVMKNLSELHLDWTTIEDSPIDDHMRSLRTFGTQDLENFREFSGDKKDPSWLGLNGIAIVELPSLIYKLTGLVTLTLRYCKYFKGLSSRICQLKSLSYLSLSGCTEFSVFPDIVENMEQLTGLDLDRTSIRELPPSIERLRGLVSLNLRNCKSFVYLPDSTCNLLNLEWLTLNGCSKLSRLPEDLWYLKRLDVMGTGIHKDNNHGPTGSHPKLQFFSTLGELAQFRGTAPLSNVVDSSCEEKEAVGVGASLNDPEESSYVEGKEEEAVAVGAILSDLEESSHKEEKEEEEKKVVAPSRRGGRIWCCICGELGTKTT
ncbi:disease resistance protein RPV1-like isoform X1 [Pyrus x bretschneideri]|uniref:disease resistance protein RPV1-like isoform X1 n=1 Tax=Pyrus x bretschneideri TaxID=225117 RepID=UPI0020301D24|nr:disease resistance protein RPV1-like isoform X1 [Pyrus x bretschneideri]